MIYVSNVKLVDVVYQIECASFYHNEVGSCSQKSLSFFFEVFLKIVHSQVNQNSKQKTKNGGLYASFGDTMHLT